jgi:hypothetical protein
LADVPKTAANPPLEPPIDIALVKPVPKVEVPVAFTLPDTSNLAAGLLTPIPTDPVEVMRSRSVLAVPNANVLPAGQNILAIEGVEPDAVNVNPAPVPEISIAPDTVSLLFGELVPNPSRSALLSQKNLGVVPVFSKKEISPRSSAPSVDPTLNTCSSPKEAIGRREPLEVTLKIALIALVEPTLPPVKDTPSAEEFVIPD